MGLIARILDSFKKDGAPGAKVEMFKNDNANARIFNPPGVDSRPLDKDICFTEDSEDTQGGKDILGFIDPKNEPVSEKGEFRAYARDADGNIVGILYLKKDGSAVIVSDADNAVRYSKLEEAFNQLKSDHNDLVATVKEMTEAFNTGWIVNPSDGGQALKTILGGITDPANSTADITPAKIDKIKVP